MAQYTSLRSSSVNPSSSKITASRAFRSGNGLGCWERIGRVLSNPNSKNRLLCSLSKKFPTEILSGNKSGSIDINPATSNVCNFINPYLETI